MKNMTALVSCFARCYHTENNVIKIYDDVYAKSILSDDEYEMISRSMSDGIAFFNPNYTGENPLQWIVNNQLAPSVLARSIFAEDYLEKEIEKGCHQYVIVAAGYDTSAYKQKNKIKVFELDREDMIEDKIRRVQQAGLDYSHVNYIKCDFDDHWIDELLGSSFSASEKAFVSCLGISYYLDKSVFANLIKRLSDHIPEGSSIVFDYPNNFVSEKENINQKMASAVNEKMKSTFSFEEISEIAEVNNMFIRAHFNDKDMDKIYFSKYNKSNPDHAIHCPQGVSYCLLSKK